MDRAACGQRPRRPRWTARVQGGPYARPPAAAARQDLPWLPPGALGRLTPAQLRSSAWRRLFPDVYACPRCRSRTSAGRGQWRISCFTGAVLSGRSAGVLWGSEDLAGDRRTPVECGRVSRPIGRAGAVRGLHVTRQRACRTDDAVRSERRPRSASPLRTALDLAPHPAGPTRRVVCGRPVPAPGRRPSTRSRATAAALTGPGRRTVPSGDRCADGLAGSPPGDPREAAAAPVDPDADRSLQHHVFDDAVRFLARGRLRGWPEQKVAARVRRRLARRRRRRRRIGGGCNGVDRGRAATVTS